MVTLYIRFILSPVVLGVGLYLGYAARKPRLPRWQRIVLASGSAALIAVFAGTLAVSIADLAQAGR